MKHFSTLFLAVAFTLAGCSDASSLISNSKKEALRKTLDPSFVIASVPKEKEEDLYRVLMIFSEGRRPNELVRSVEFKSADEAHLLFSDFGMHGGGSATLQKKAGKWTMIHEIWFL